MPANIIYKKNACINQFILNLLDLFMHCTFHTKYLKSRILLILIILILNYLKLIISPFIIFIMNYFIHLILVALIILGDFALQEKIIILPILIILFKFFLSIDNLVLLTSIISK